MHLPKSGDPKVRKTTATMDHIISKALGGGNGYDNVVLACNSCNAFRNHRDWRPPVNQIEDKSPE